jgi:tetratricopeptide (TPR) repeat protein
VNVISKRRLSAVWVVLLLLFACGAGAQSRRGRSPEPGAVVVQGLAEVDSLLGLGQSSQAVNRARDLLSEYESDPMYGWQLEERLGVALLRAGQADQALPFLEQAVRRNPTFWMGHRNLAAALMSMGRRGRALSEFRQAVNSAPDNFEVRLEFGQVLLEYKNYNEAALHLEAARDLCPECPRIRPALARLYLGNSEWDRAIDILLSLYREDRSDDYRRTLIQALQTAGRDSLLLDLWAEADIAQWPVDEIRSLVEAEARLSKPNHSLAFARRLDGTEDPLRELGEAGRTLGNEARFWGTISLTLLQSGHFIDALRAADRAVFLAPENVVYRNNRVVLLTRLGRHEEAAAEWKKVLLLDPTLETQEGR